METKDGFDFSHKSAIFRTHENVGSTVRCVKTKVNKFGFAGEVRLNWQQVARWSGSVECRSSALEEKTDYHG